MFKITKKNLTNPTLKSKDNRLNYLSAATFQKRNKLLLEIIKDIYRHHIQLFISHAMAPFLPFLHPHTMQCFCLCC
jgi:hypothetical protein